MVKLGPPIDWGSFQELSMSDESLSICDPFISINPRFKRVNIFLLNKRVLNLGKCEKKAHL